MKIDAQDHAFIVEELDDQTLVIKENMLSILKQKLDDVRDAILCTLRGKTDINRF